MIPFPPGLLTPSTNGGGIDVDAILATGGVVRVNSFDLTIDTTPLSSMSDGLVIANTEPSNWTFILIATSIETGENYRITSDPDGEDTQLGAADKQASEQIGVLGTYVDLPTVPVVAGVSQVNGGAVIARANGASLSGFSAPGNPVPGVGSSDYELAGSGPGGQFAFIIIPSALSSAEIDAIYSATIFP